MTEEDKDKKDESVPVTDPEGTDSKEEKKQNKKDQILVASDGEIKLTIKNGNEVQLEIQRGIKRNTDKTQTEI